MPASGLPPLARTQPLQSGPESVHGRRNQLRARHFAPVVPPSGEPLERRAPQLGEHLDLQLFVPIVGRFHAEFSRQRRRADHVRSRLDLPMGFDDLGVASALPKEHAPGEGVLLSVVEEGVDSAPYPDVYGSVSLKAGSHMLDSPVALTLE